MSIIYNNKSLIGHVNTEPDLGATGNFEPQVGTIPYAMNFNANHGFSAGCSYLENITNRPIGSDFTPNNIVVNMRVKSDHGLTQLTNGISQRLRCLFEIKEVGAVTRRYTMYAHTDQFGNFNTLGLFDGTAWRFFGPTITDGEWHDFKLIITPGFCEVLIDDVSRGVNPCATFTFTPATNVSVNIARRDFGDYLRCKVSYFKIESGANTILEYKFLEGPNGLTVADSSGNGRTGTANNMPVSNRWVYAKGLETARQIRNAIDETIKIPRGLHIVDTNVLEIPGREILEGVYKWNTFLRPTQDHSDRLPVVDMPLNVGLNDFGINSFTSNEADDDFSPNRLATVVNHQFTGVTVPAMGQRGGPMTHLNRFVHFNSANTGHIVLDNYAAIQGLGPFGIETWIRTTPSYTPPGNVYIASKTNVLNTEWELFVDTSFEPTLRVFDGTGFRTFSVTGTNLNDGNWHQIVVNPYITGAEYFQDGQLVAQGPYDIAGSWVPIGNTSPLILGARYDLLERGDFDLAGFRLYNRPRYREEVVERYRARYPSMISSKNIGFYNKTNFKWVQLDPDLVTQASIKHISVLGTKDNADGFFFFYGEPYLYNGIDIYGMGSEIRDISVCNIPGNAIYVDTGSASRQGSLKIADNEKPVYQNLFIQKCYNGLVLENDADASVDHYQGIGCRDFNLDLRNNGAVYADNIHCFGGTVGMRVGNGGPCYLSKIQGDNGYCGFINDTGDTIMSQFIGKQCQYFCIDAIRPIHCSLAYISVPPSEAGINVSGNYDYTYYPAKPANYQIPSNYYRGFNEAGGPIGVRIQQTAPGCRFDNLHLINEAGTGTTISGGGHTLGMEIRSAKNRIRGRIANLDMAMIINYQFAHNNDIDVTIENCVTGVVISPACTNARGGEITIYWRNIPGGVSNVFVDQTAGVFTANNNITLVQLNT